MLTTIHFVFLKLISVFLFATDKLNNQIIINYQSKITGLKKPVI